MRSYPGSVEDRLCRCERTELGGPGGLRVVTRAVCCSSRGPAVSGGVVCPPHLPHTARYRSARRELSCPQHSQAYKCVCLGQNRDIYPGLSLVDSSIVLLRQLSYAIKNQLVASKAPYLGLWNAKYPHCSSLVLYGIRIGSFHSQQCPNAHHQ